MKFCLYIPVGNVTPGQFQSPAAVSEMTKAIEQADIDACCVTDHPAPSSEWLHANGHDALDPFTALAFVAAASSRLLLQTNILVLPYRNPFLTAKAATTLQVLSGGRFILGVGSGYQKAEFDALGVDFHKRGRLTDEALETIREIWAGGNIVKKGMGFYAKGNEPRPSPEPQPKIWIGGSSDAALRRAVKHGDGWCPFFSIARHSKLNQDSGIQSVADLKNKVETILQARQQQNLQTAFDVNIAISSVDNFINRSQGEIDQFQEDLRQLEGAGVNWVTLKLPHPSRAAYIENVQWFAENFVAKI